MKLFFQNVVATKLTGYEPVNYFCNCGEKATWFIETEQGEDIGCLCQLNSECEKNLLEN